MKKILKWLLLAVSLVALGSLQYLVCKWSSNYLELANQYVVFWSSLVLCIVISCLAVIKFFRHKKLILLWGVANAQVAIILFWTLYLTYLIGKEQNGVVVYKSFFQVVVQSMKSSSLNWFFALFTAFLIAFIFNKIRIKTLSP
jgi:hypothetical protein